MRCLRSRPVDAGGAEGSGDGHGGGRAHEHRAIQPRGARYYHGYYVMRYVLGRCRTSGGRLPFMFGDFGQNPALRGLRDVGSTYPLPSPVVSRSHQGFKLQPIPNPPRIRNGRREATPRGWKDLAVSIVNRSQRESFINHIHIFPTRILETRKLNVSQIPISTTYK